VTEDVTAAEAAPTCYRHPGRETYVRCTRCDRPICPECMTEAAVGFQCPECVREGNKSVRGARTVFGGRVAADAYVTKALIGLNVLAFVAQLASSAVTDRFLMLNEAVWRNDEYYRMLTSAFLHDTGFLLHIAFNMYALFLFGSQVERLLGGVRYLVLYLIAGFGGSLAYLLFVPYGASLGASGAVFGLFGAYFVFARKMRADTSQLVFLIGLNLFIGFAARGYINNYAHIGGLLTGGLVALLYTSVPRGRRQTALQLGGAAAVALVLVVVTVVRSNDLRQDPPPPPARSESSALSTSGTGAPSR
jgi:membrane associated rhomboid family serine protease